MSNPRVPFELADRRHPLPAPNGRPLVVNVVVNVEHWRFDRPMPRKVLGAPHGVEPVPDVPNFSWSEYGMRCGLPRLIRLLAEFEVATSVSFNASVIEAYPAAAEAIRDAGWEFIGHGLHQQALPAADDEREVVAGSLDAIERFTGSRPRGWLGPGLQETMDTPDVLSAAGVEYVCDWTVDDLPVWVEASPRPLVGVPYSLELNDSVIYAVERQSSPEIWRRTCDTLAVFDSELVDAPRVLPLPLHPHLIGVPHRIVYLRKILETLRARRDVVFMTGGEIHDWYHAAATPTPGSGGKA